MRLQKELKAFASPFFGKVSQVSLLRDRVHGKGDLPTITED